jgi:hypothetical protein
MRNIVNENKIKDLLSLPKNEIVFTNSMELDGVARSFTVFSEQWPLQFKEQKLQNPQLVDLMMVGFSDPVQGTAGEFSITFESSSSGGISSKLQVFYDGFKALANMPDLIEWLSKNENCNVLQLKQALIKMGYCYNLKY